MKKISFTLCLLFAGGSALANSSNLYNTGKIFVGPEVGFFGVATNVSLSVMGGYQFYFKEDWQFSGFRHGVRGFASAGWANYRYGYGSAFVGQIGADWTIDFNIKDRFVWGAYVGISLGFSNISQINFMPNANIGGSLTIDKTHRVELNIGNITTGIVSLRYLYMF